MTKHARGSIAVALVTTLAVLAGPVALRQASADDQAAGRQHFQRGRQLYDQGDYRAAISEFAAADQAAPSPMLEYNIALCHEKLGERPEAIRRYKNYLGRVPNAQNRASVEAKIAKLVEEIRAAAPPADGPLPPYANEPPAASEPPPAASEPPPAARPAPTGDPELDRVAAIDIGRVQSERGGAAPPNAPPPGAPPPSASGAGPSGPPPGAPAPSDRPAPSDNGDKKESKPIYKQWWFWVVAGISAIILIDIATSESDSSSNALVMPGGVGDPRSLGSQGGAVLLRF